MLKELRDLLMKIVSDIDSGNSNIDESQTIEIVLVLMMDLQFMMLLLRNGKMI